MTAVSRNSSQTGSKIGLALAGGGPQGAIYEIGALRALDEVLDGVVLNDLFVYVGISAGAFIAANLANGLTTAQMVRAIVKHEPGEHPFVSETFFQPAIKEFARRGLSVPRILLSALWESIKNPEDRRLLDAFTDLGRALPVGVFDNEPIRAYVEKIYGIKGRTNDFRLLEKQLIIVAADLDSGESVRFGGPGWEHVPISVAVQASTALPGLYPPVEIDGRYYADGVLLKTLHASVPLEAGADLVLCINPLVPVDTAQAVKRGVMKRGRLIDRGLPAVLSQSIRTMIRSRLDAGLEAYGHKYSSELILIEPRRDDYDVFFSNVFSFSNRRNVCEHAYNSTRADLLARYDELQPILERHGAALSRQRLESPGDLWGGVARRASQPGPSLLSPVHSESTVEDLDRVLDRIDALLATS